jgi:hypothetical protein
LGEVDSFSETQELLATAGLPLPPLSYHLTKRPTLKGSRSILRTYIFFLHDQNCIVHSCHRRFGWPQGGCLCHRSPVDHQVAEAQGRSTSKKCATAGFAGHSWAAIAIISVVVAVLVAFSIPRSSAGGTAEPLPRLEYDIDEIGEYWAQRPVAVASRSAAVAFEGMRWGVGKTIHTKHTAICPQIW